MAEPELARDAVQSALDPSRYEALLQLADLISSPLELTSLFHQLSVRLKSVVNFDFLNLMIYDSQRNVMRLQIWEGMPVPGGSRRIVGGAIGERLGAFAPDGAGPR